MRSLAQKPDTEFDINVLVFAVLKMIYPLEKSSQVMLYWGQRKSRRVQPRRPGRNALTEPSNERWLLEQATKSREIPLKDARLLVCLFFSELPERPAEFGHC
jgi:hypothetical protein